MNEEIKPTWIIETGIFEEDDVCQTLISLVKSKGCEVREIRYLGFGADIEGVNDLEDKCVISMSSINAIKKCKRSHKWYPGQWCDFDKLTCQSYYGNWYPYLLNQQAEFVPWKVLKERVNQLYCWYGASDKGVFGIENSTIFIRPDSNDKVFSGEPVSKKEFESFAMMVDNYLGEEESPLCLVSTPKKILKEWRFYVSEGKVLTGSLYREGSKIKYDRSYPKEAVDLVEKAASEWMPHPICCIDIAEIEEYRTGEIKYKIIECGSINCAGLYEADLEKIVDEMNRLAVEDWKEYFEDEK